MNVRTVPEIIAAADIRRVLEKQKANVLGATAKPSVLNQEHWTCPLVPIVVTDFLDGQECQHLHILGNGNATVSNNAKIKTNTGANKLLLTNRMYEFVMFNGIWIEAD